MRKKLIALTAAVIIFMPGLKGRLFAGEDITRIAASEPKQIAVSEENSVAGKMDTEEANAAEARKAEEAKKNIVARVNGADINMFMLVRAMNRVASKYVKEGENVSPETTTKIKLEAFDRLIFEELAVQEAVRQGINPAPDTIDKVVAQIRENLGTEEAYRQYLDKSYLNEDTLKKLIERSQRYELITAREIYGKIKVDEKPLREEYEKEKGRFVLPEKFVAEDVYILQGKDEEATERKGREILKILGKNNNDVWKLVLDGTFIVRKINIVNERNPAIYKAMTDIKEGDLSGVIRDKDGFHIIKVIKKEPSRQLTFEEAKSAIETRFLVPAQDQRKEKWREELRKNAKIEIMLDDAGNGHVKNSVGQE